MRAGQYSEIRGIGGNQSLWMGGVMIKPFSEMKYGAAKKAADRIVDLSVTNSDGNLKAMLLLIDTLAFHSEAKESAGKMKMHYETNRPLYRLVRRMVKELNANDCE